MKLLLKLSMLALLSGFALPTTASVTSEAEAHPASSESFLTTDETSFIPPDSAEQPDAPPTGGDEVPADDISEADPVDTTVEDGYVFDTPVDETVTEAEVTDPGEVSAEELAAYEEWLTDLQREYEFVEETDYINTDQPFILDPPAETLPGNTVQDDANTQPVELEFDPEFLLESFKPEAAMTVAWNGNLDLPQPVFALQAAPLQVAEPAVLSLFLGSLAGLFLRRRRKSS